MVKDNIVKNIIVVDSENPINIPGYKIIYLKQDQKVKSGDKWDGNKFIPSPPKPRFPNMIERAEALEEALLDLL